MSQCSYIYTKEGIRLPDHKIIVRVRMGDRDLVLRLVRAGKGRSRIDRWENNPQSYGVTGEINTRDLALWHESGELTLWQAHYTPDEKDHAEPVWLDLDRIMGREGREQAGEGLVRALQSLQTLNPGMKSRDNWIIDAILRYAPYGEENSAHYRDAIDMVLPDEDGVGSGYKVSADDIAEKIRSGAVNFMLHCSDDKLEAMMFHPSVREAVESVIKDVSSEQHSLVERLSLVSKIVEAKSYLRRNGRDMQHLMSIHAFSVTDLARMVEDAPLELFDLMAETAPEDAANCIRDGVINTSEAVLLAASLLQRGHSLDKDTVARIAGLMYNGINYHSALSRVVSVLPNDQYAIKSAAITSSVVTATMRDHPSVLHALGAIQGGGPSYSIRAAVAHISREILADTSERDAELLSYAAEMVLKNRVGIRYEGMINANADGGLNGARVDAVETLSLMRALRNMPESHAERLVSEISQSDAASSVGRERILYREDVGPGMKERVMLAAALSGPARDGYEFLLGRDRSGDSVNYAEGMFYALSRPEMAKGWVEHTVRTLLDEKATQPYDFRSDDRHDARAVRASVIAALVSSDSGEEIERIIMGATAPFSGARAKKEADVSFERDSDSAWRAPSKITKDGRDPSFTPAFENSEDLRIGVALGTSDVTLLESILEDPREHVAGPVAAMRIIGHPSFPRLNTPVPAKLAEKARQMVEATKKPSPGDSLSLVMRAAAVTQALLSTSFDDTQVLSK